MKAIGAIGIGIGVVVGVTTGLTVKAMHKLKAQVMEALTKEPSYRVSGPLVSVIIPALEEQDYLPKLLMSIQNQTYEPIEVIVADSSTRDNHELADQICWQYGTTCLHISMLGPANARNQGARQAQGDILFFTDADNVLASDCIENLIRSLQEGYIAAHPVECIIDDTGLAAFGAVWITNWLKGANATTRAVAIWKDAFDQVKYDESCDPLQGCREDLKFGKDIIERFGPGSIKLDRDALIGTSARRFKKQGLIPGKVPWEYRGVRDGVINKGGKAWLAL